MLHLHYTLAPGLLLDEIIDECPNQTFFLTRDSIARDDLERRLLEGKNQNGLFGRCLQSIESWKQELLWEHPTARTPAPPPIQAKILRQILASEGPNQKAWNGHQLKRILLEWKRLDQLERIGGKSLLPSSWRKSFEVFEHEIEKKTPYWAPSQAEREAFQRSNLAAWFRRENFSQLWIIGFYLPEAELLDLLQTIQTDFPRLEIHLTLAAPEIGVDPHQLLSPIYAALENSAKSVERHSFSPPLLKFQEYPTSLHEISSALNSKQASNSSDFRILSPPASKTFHQLQRHLAEFSESDEAAYPLPWHASSACLKWLYPQPNSLTGDFEAYFQWLHCSWQSLRQLLAEDRDGVSLRYLDHLESSLSAYRILWADSSEIKDFSSWAKDLNEEIPLIFPPPPLAPISSQGLRSLGQPGLSLCDHLWIIGLDDGAYPGSNQSFLTMEGFQDPLSVHEKKIALYQACFLGKKAVKLSYSKLSPEGRELSSSRFLDLSATEFDQTKEAPLFIPKFGRHPYFDENVRREQRRLENGPCDVDRGLLSASEIVRILQRTLYQRPLSASYLEDYALCPWRFFARWHLRLDSSSDETLEFRPIDRGKIQHHALEKVFSHLFTDYISKKIWPSPEALEKSVANILGEMRENHRDQAPFNQMPPVLCEDFFERIQDQILSLLGKEIQQSNLAQRTLWPRYFEWEFGRKGSSVVYFALNAESQIPLAGKIDRIDVDEESKMFLVIDYKNSNTSELASRIREGKSFQLFLYQYAVKQELLPQHQSLGGLYWDLKALKKDQGWVEKISYLPYAEKKPRSSSFLDEDDFNEQNNEFENKLKIIFKRIFEGDFSLNPTECQGELCSYFNICRYSQRK